MDISFSAMYRQLYAGRILRVLEGFFYAFRLDLYARTYCICVVSRIQFQSGILTALHCFKILEKPLIYFNLKHFSKLGNCYTAATMSDMRF